MTPKTTLRLCLLAGCCAVLVARPARAQTDLRIGGWAFTVNGHVDRRFEYTGACPVKLGFDWSVISPEFPSISYIITRNDGARVPGRQTAQVSGPNHEAFIHDEWQLGANAPEFANYHGWLQLNVIAQVPATRRINFTLHCT